MIQTEFRKKNHYLERNGIPYEVNKCMGSFASGEVWGKQVKST